MAITFETVYSEGFFDQLYLIEFFLTNHWCNVKTFYSFIKTHQQININNWVFLCQNYKNTTGFAFPS